MQIGYFGIINLKQMLKNVSFNISSELLTLQYDSLVC